jgi:cell division septation protein DedD
MAINAVYFGWKFMEVSSPQTTVAEKSMPQVGARIQLLGESNLARTPAPAPAEPVEEAPPAVAEAPAVRQCFNVGPFASEGEARGLVSQLKGKRFMVRLDRRKVDIKDYWVFIPAFTNRERADEKMRELRARGISGFVVKEGPFINAISLNRFSQKDLAQSFLGKMQEAGLTVESREMSSPGFQVWAYASPGSSRADLRGTIDDFLESREALKREIASCEE